jgi:hypothetical protein
VGYVALIKETRNVYRLFVGKPEGKKPLDKFHVDGKIILGRVLKNMHIERKLVRQDQNTGKWRAHTERVREF